MKKYTYWFIIIYPVVILIIAFYGMFFAKGNLIARFVARTFIVLLVIALFLVLVLMFIKPKRAHKIMSGVSQEDNEEPTTTTERIVKEKKHSYFGNIHDTEMDSIPKQKKIDVNHETKDGIFFFNVPKLLESKSDDNVFVQKHGPEIVMGVSDGASTSLYSGLWGKNILKYFSRELYKYTSDKQKFLSTLSEFVDVAGKERSRVVQAKKLPWHAYAKLSKGSDASLTGVHIIGDTLSYAIIGDSPLIIISPKDNKVFFYPYKNSAEFKQNPILINTDNTHNESLKESLIMGTYKMKANERVVICSDGIGKFLLSIYEKNHDEFLKVIDAIISAKNPISNLITEFKNNGYYFADEKVVMKDDDTSFIHFTYKKKHFPW